CSFQEDHPALVRTDRVRMSRKTLEGPMRILVADSFPEEHRNRLAEAHDCAYEPDTTADQLPDRLVGCEVLVVRSTRVTAEALESADALRLVVRAGSGTNTIDRDA